MLVYCAVGQMVINQSANASDELYCSSGWYECPPHLRHNLVIIIRQMQQPMHMRGLGARSFGCSLENYSNVNLNRLIPARCQLMGIFAFSVDRVLLFISHFSSVLQLIDTKSETIWNMCSFVWSSIALITFYVFKFITVLSFTINKRSQQFWS